VAQGDLGLKGNSNSIMKPKKNPGAQFNAADITQNDDGAKNKKQPSSSGSLPKNQSNKID
jgi:hypothetical protein